MATCCPRGHGCNDPDKSEPCVLSLFRAAAGADEEAAQALARWRALEAAVARGCGERERRFRRRAFERARDRALIGLAMRSRPQRAPHPARKRPRHRARTKLARRT